MSETKAERAARSAAYRAWKAERPSDPAALDAWRARRPPYAGHDKRRAKAEPTPEPVKPAGKTDLPRSKVVCILSDIHLPHPHARAWAAVRQWHARTQPDWTILDGDVLDMCAASRFEKQRDDPPHLLEEIEQFVREANSLVAECGRLTFVAGNHDLRWDKLIGGANPQALKGIMGLSLQEICEKHGLSRRVEWFRETPRTPGLEVGTGCIVRHGDKQAGRFGSVNPATNRLNKSMGVSEVVGHHHMAALATRHAHGRDAFVVCNPCLSEMQAYAGSDNTWAHGFTVLEVAADGLVTPHLVLVRDGRFSWGGVTYGAAA